MNKWAKDPPLFFRLPRSIKKSDWPWSHPSQAGSGGTGFEVPLDGKKVTGVVLCQQVKMIDFSARGIRFAEKARATVTSDALAKVRAIVSE